MAACRLMGPGLPGRPFPGGEPSGPGDRLPECPGRRPAGSGTLRPQLRARPEPGRAASSELRSSRPPGRTAVPCQSAAGVRPGLAGVRSLSVPSRGPTVSHPGGTGGRVAGRAEVTNLRLAGGRDQRVARARATETGGRAEMGLAGVLRPLTRQQGHSS
jgi:hypothetical protein